MAISTYTPPKTWAYKESLSSADMNLYVRDNTIALKEMHPIAEFVDIAYDGTPDGPFLLCDGSAISRATYAALFAKVGTTWGVGDGSTTFNLPDGRGRGRIGAGTGTGLTARTVGQSLGEENHVLTVSEMPSHTHAPTGNNFLMDGAGSVGGVASGGGFAKNNVTASRGGDGGHNNIQPSYVVKTFIRYA